MRWGLRITVLAAVVAAVSYVSGQRVDPASVPQETWHQIATNSEQGLVHPLPRAHDVVVKAPEQTAVGVLVRYLPPPVGSGGTAEMQGRYNPETGKIEVTGDLARLQACYKVPALRGILYRTLRHEYGHAFLSDWVSRGTKGKQVALPYAEGGQADPEQLPKALVPVYEEYKKLPDTFYGQAYVLSSFDEYMAESYARFVSGQDIPKETLAFFEGYCKAEKK